MNDTRDPGPAPHETLDRLGGVHRLHLVVVAGSLLLTLGAWSVSRHALEQRNRARFGRQADHVVEQLAETLDRQAGLLRAAAGFVESSGDEARDAWRAFSDALDLEERYPALGGLAVVRRVPRADLPALLAERARTQPEFELRPAHDEPVHLPVVMDAREGTSTSMLGYDLAFEANRREAIAAAFDGNAVRLTAPVRPAGGRTAGTIMVAPYHALRPEESPADGPPTGTRAGTGFAGVVATSMFFDRLFAGTLDPSRRDIRLRIDDGGASVLDETVGGTDLDLDPAPLLTQERSLAVHGRDWRIRIETTRGFRAAAGVATPWVVLGSGLIIDALLAALLWLHLRGSHRLLVAARGLHAERLALARSNEMLETFACVVSHDLKTPLASIGMLVDTLEEDVRDERPRAELLRTTTRVRAKIDRADALVDGVLEYSGLGRQEETGETVDLAGLLRDIRDALDVSDDALGFDGDLGGIDTVEVRLRQVLTNLVGNAFKYHDAPERAHVHVRVERLDGWLRVSVADDGPGIDPRSRDRIFEPFFCGHGTDRADSSGVGLAIVWKSVTAMGGTIELVPTAGRGTTFTFTWPASVPSGDACDDVPADGRDLPDLRFAA